MMRNYFKAVTLGAFTWKDADRVGQFVEQIRKTSGLWLAVHLLLLTVCLNFPNDFSIINLTPYQLNSRIAFYTENPGENVPALPKDAGDEDAVKIFNDFMLQNGYRENILPLFLISLYLQTLIIQLIFYLCAVFFLKLSRLHVTQMNFRERMGLALYSSTMPALFCSIFGFFMPTLHIIVFYFIVIFFIFQRSRLCPNG